MKRTLMIMIIVALATSASFAAVHTDTPKNGEGFYALFKRNGVAQKDFQKSLELNKSKAWYRNLNYLPKEAEVSFFLEVAPTIEEEVFQEEGNQIVIGETAIKSEIATTGTHGGAEFLSSGWMLLGMIGFLLGFAFVVWYFGSGDQRGSQKRRGPQQTWDGYIRKQWYYCNRYVENGDSLLIRKVLLPVLVVLFILRYCISFFLGVVTLFYFWERAEIQRNDRKYFLKRAYKGVWAKT